MTTEALSTPFQSSRGHSISARNGGKERAGRDESRAVRRYLEALDARPPTGNGMSPQGMAKRIEAIDAQLAGADPVVKVRLIHERMDLYAQLKASEDGDSLDELEQGFVSAARAYSMRKGISYAAWREVGVGHEVLKRAGIPKTA